MIEKFTFDKDLKLEEKFIYVSSPASRSKKKFLRKEDYIENSYNEEIQDFDYISIITKKRYDNGVKVKAKCSFDSFGAPLLVLTDDCRKQGEGQYQYGLHFEIVAYENGCNVWHIVPGKDSSPIEVTKVGSMEFHIEAKNIIEIEIYVKNKRIDIRINDKRMVAEHEELPDRMHVGITACEGINQFYELEVSSEEKENG